MIASWLLRTPTKKNSTAWRCFPTPAATFIWGMSAIMPSLMSFPDTTVCKEKTCFSPWVGMPLDYQLRTRLWKIKFPQPNGRMGTSITCASSCNDLVTPMIGQGSSPLVIVITIVGSSGSLPGYLKKG